MNKNLVGLLVFGALTVTAVPALGIAAWTGTRTAEIGIGDLRLFTDNPLFELATWAEARMEVGGNDLQFFRVSRGSEGSAGVVKFRRGNERECFSAPQAPRLTGCFRP